MSKDKLLSLIKEEDADYVDIRFTDPRGKLQHVTVVADLVDEDFIEEGFMFDGSSIAGWKSIDQSDMKLMPDPDSAYVDPFYAEKTFIATWSNPTRWNPTSATPARPRSRPRPI
jgi:glutamine synthetase